MNKYSIGEKVRVTSTGHIAKISQIWVDGETETFYWVQTTYNKFFKIHEKNLTKFSISDICPFKHMKIKSYKMVIIPFEFVPHQVVFRYDAAWWKRVVGSAHQAESFIDSSDLDNNDIADFTEIIPDNALVAINKSSLQKPLSHAYILDEFDLKDDEF